MGTGSVSQACVCTVSLRLHRALTLVHLLCLSTLWTGCSIWYVSSSLTHHAIATDYRESKEKFGGHYVGVQTLWPVCTPNSSPCWSQTFYKVCFVISLDCASEFHLYAWLMWVIKRVCVRWANHHKCVGMYFLRTRSVLQKPIKVLRTSNWSCLMLICAERGQTLFIIILLFIIKYYYSI